MRTKASKGMMLALFPASVLTSGFGVTVLAHSGDIIVAVTDSTPIICGSIEAGEWDMLALLLFQSRVAMTVRFMSSMMVSILMLGSAP